MIVSSKLVFTLCLFSLFISISSCETSKVAYGNHYYFRAHPKLAAEPKTKVASLPATDELLVQVEHQIQDTDLTTAKIKETTEAVEQISEESASDLSLMPVSPLQKRSLTTKGKAERKELKKEVKDLVKEYRKAPENMEEHMAVSRNTRTGIILGAVGLILMVIGGSPLYTVGAILLIVGLVVILLDVL